MEELFQEFLSDPKNVAFVAYLLFMSAIQALPEPTQSSSPFYSYFFRFAHGFSMNWGMNKKVKRKLKMTGVK